MWLASGELVRSNAIVVLENREVPWLLLTLPNHTTDFRCGFPQMCGHGTVWAQDGSSVMEIFVDSLGLWRRWTHRILVWQRQLHPCYSFRLGRELLRGMVAQSGLHFRAGLPLMWSYLTNCLNEIWVTWYELLLDVASLKLSYLLLASLALGLQCRSGEMLALD